MNNCKQIIFGIMFLASVFATLATNREAIAANVLELKIADSLPNGHMIHSAVTKPFIEAVERESKGQIKFKHFPGEQLGKSKDMLMITQSGMTDIGYVVPAYIGDKMLFSSVMELPGAFNNYNRGMNALWNLTHNGGFLEVADFAPNKIVPILTFMFPAYQMHISKNKKISSLDDIKGLKIRSVGGSMEFMLRDLGVVPVRLNAPEMYEALHRGTIDGVMFSAQSVVNYSLNDSIKASTTAYNFGTVVLTYSISTNKWKQLPENVRQILLRVGEQVSKSAADKIMIGEKASLSKMKGNGLKIISFDANNEKKLANVFVGVGNEWASSLAKRGKPGFKALKAMQQALNNTK